MSTLTPGQMHGLETLIDQHGLFEVVVALDVICGDKAAHLRANASQGSGDKRLAYYWDLASAVFNTAAKGSCVQRVSP